MTDFCRHFFLSDKAINEKEWNVKNPLFINIEFIFEIYNYLVDFLRINFRNNFFDYFSCYRIKRF